jgi:hypothetical protein
MDTIESKPERELNGVVTGFSLGFPMNGSSRRSRSRTPRSTFPSPTSASRAPYRSR